MKSPVLELMIEESLPLASATHPGRSLDVSVVIVTFGRHEVLTDSIAYVLPQIRGGELIVVDQNPSHPAETESRLAAWEASGEIRRIRLQPPSITSAMNTGLQAARSPVVLFVDDDIIPQPELVAKHLAAHREFPEAWAVNGQVLQPGESSGRRGEWTRGRQFRADLDFPFWSDEREWVSNVIACNLSVKRDRALEAGGFDENFSGSAYRFETEFARRLESAGGKVLFEPAAGIRHLKSQRGGTRAHGSHLTSASGRHGMGDYYFALRHARAMERVAYIARRPFREVCTRFHARHPWYIPVKLVGEIRALCSAIGAWWRPPRLLPASGSISSPRNESV